MAVDNSTDNVRMGGSGLTYPLPYETFSMQVSAAGIAGFPPPPHLTTPFQ
jgi:hypothetical protein